MFWRVQSLPFLNYDDSLHVTQNQYLQPASAQRIWFFWRYPFDPTPAPGIKWESGGMAPPYEQIYSPLAFTTWALLTFVAREKAVTPLPLGQQPPLDPAIYHAFNLLLHVGNTVLLFLLLRRLVKSDWGAALGALLFGIHPLQVEPVAWVTGMNNLLASFFCLGSLHFYLSHLDVAEQENRPWRRWRFWLGAIALFALALLAKPSAAPLPLIALLLCWLHKNQDWRRRILEMLPWFLLVGVTIVINRSLQVAQISSAAVAPYLRPFLIGDALAFYGAKLLWPLQLAPDYGRKPGWILSHWWGYVTWMAPVAVFVVAWWRWRVSRQQSRWFWQFALAGFAIFFVTVLPTSGIVTYYFHLISTVADRYCYFALVGASLIVAALIARVENSRWGLNSSLARCTLGIFMALAVGGSVVVQRQIGYWQSGLMLFQHSLSVNPRSTTALSVVGSTLADQKRYTEAIAVLEKGLSLEPDNWILLNKVGIIYHRMGQTRTAIFYFQKTLKVFPASVDAHLRLGKIYHRQNKLQQAIYHLGEGLKVRPENPDLLASYGVVAGKLGNAPIAERCLRDALKNGFDPASGHLFLGIALAINGKLNDAMSQWNQSLRLNPNLFETHYNIGLGLLKQGKTQGAIASFEETIRLKPSHAPAYFDLAVALRKLGRIQEARQRVNTALALKSDYPAARQLLRSLEKEAHKNGK